MRDPYGIAVTVQGVPLPHPFLGGLYNPMHQFADIDGDADYDLFLFDVNDGSVTFMRNVGTTMDPSWRWEPPDFLLPPLRGWFRLVDLTGDGLRDLLTAGDSLNTVAVYRHDGTATTPHFTRIPGVLRDDQGVPVFVQEQCIPALADIDGDADPDLFSINPSVGTINFYENTGAPGFPLFTFRTDFYQAIRICPGCSSPGGLELHGQGTMEFSDIDADGDYDMLYGDLFDEGLFFYRNIGTPTVALLDSVTGRFPDADPVVTAGFNQATLHDIDADGDPDLFVSVLPPFQQKDNFYFYRNTGTPAAFEFTLVTRNALLCLDQGLQSAPALADLDADGDGDLVIGDLFGRVALFENIGTPLVPAFRLQDSALIASITRFAYVPAFTDMDGDGDQDLVLGHFGGSMEFYRNTGTPSQPAFLRQMSAFDSIAVGLYAAPAFFDFDDDGDPDLFVGNGNGRIALYRNDGPPSSPTLTLLTAQFQGIERSANSRPTFGDMDGDGDSDLIVGEAGGIPVLYRNDGPPGAPVFTEVPGWFPSTEVMRESSPAAADLDGDGDRDLIVGNLRGGLLLYRNDHATAVREPEPEHFPQSPLLLDAFPSPFNGGTTLAFSTPVAGEVCLRIVDLLGRTVETLASDRVAAGEHRYRWNAAGRASGVYLVVLDTRGRRATRTLLLLR